MDLATLDFDELGHRFQMTALKRQEWTHATHLCVGAWYIERLGLERSICQLRVGIKRLNGVLGTPNTESCGYHETITVCYARLIAHFMSLCPPFMSFRERVTRLTESALANSDFLFNFYSRELLLSVPARTAFVEPDLRQLSLPSDILVRHMAKARAHAGSNNAERGSCRFC